MFVSKVVDALKTQETGVFMATHYKVCVAVRAYAHARSCVCACVPAHKHMCGCVTVIRQ